VPTYNEYDNRTRSYTAITTIALSVNQTHVARYIFLERGAGEGGNKFVGAACAYVTLYCRKMTAAVKIVFFVIWKGIGNGGKSAKNKLSGAAAPASPWLCVTIFGEEDARDFFSGGGTTNLGAADCVTVHIVKL